MPTGSETTPPYAPWSSRFGGWCRRMALHNLRVECQKRRRRRAFEFFLLMQMSCSYILPCFC